MYAKMIADKFEYIERCLYAFAESYKFYLWIFGCSLDFSRLLHSNSTEYISTSLRLLTVVSYSFISIYYFNSI